MVSQHHYEGPDLQVLLQQVGHDLGEDAHIVSAQKVRSGGVGGFFVRERFEVVAEPGDSKLAGTVTSAPSADTDASTSSAPSTDHGDDFTPDPNAARDILELADRMNDAEAWQPAVSTQSETFAEVLARVNEVVGRAEDPTPSAVRIEVESAPAPIPFPHPEPEHGPDLPPAARATRAPRAPRTRAAIQALDALGLPAPMLPASSTRDMRHELIVRLQQLPLPLPLPEDPGAVIAVIGPGTSAQTTAERIADELGVATDDIVVAGDAGAERPAWCQVPDAASAASRRRAWWRRATPTVVIVDTADASTDWAADMLQALEPNLAVGIVDARAKIEDTTHWCDALAIDLLEVEHTDRTMSPASVLHVGVPVTRIDGVDATPDAWADLLLERSR